MIKIQMKRIYSNKDLWTHKIDEKFCAGSVDRLPIPGETIVFHFDRLGKGSWVTTPVQRIEYNGDVMSVITENSEYQIKKGWDNEN